MLRRSVWRLFLILAAIFALATPALAGGWAVVTLDALPTDIQAGQSMSLGFMVRQHGKTPIDHNPWENKPLEPALSATNKETGETIRATARKEGPVGHFVVDVTFPQAGSWDITITPPPFEGTLVGTFVVAAAGKAVQQERQAVAATQQQAANATIPATQSARVWLVTAFVIVAALGLTALVQRESLGRLLLARSTRPVRPSDESQASRI